MADTYTEALDQRQLSILRLAQSMIKEISNPALDEAYRAARLAILDRDAPRTLTQLDALKKAMTNAYLVELEKGFKPLTEELGDLSVEEAAFMARTMTEFAPETFALPADKVVKRYVDNSVMNFAGKNEQAFSWDEYLDTFYATSAKNLRGSVTNVWREQSLTGSLPTLNHYVDRIRLTNNQVNKKDAETIVRSGVTHFSTQGRMAFYDDNKDVIEKLYINVTFDNKISKTCVSISSRYGPGTDGFTMDNQPPEGLPGYHPNCRSGVIAVAIGQDIEGDRQAIEGRKGKEATDAFKAREDRLRTKSKVTYKGKKDDVLIAKEISAATPIAKFLRDQPAYFVDDVLGKTAGLAFRKGELDLSQLTTGNLRPKTLAELKLE